MESPARLTQQLGLSTTEPPAERILETLDRMAVAINRLKQENEHLLRVRGQALIHLKQIELDRDRLRDLVRHYRMMLYGGGDAAPVQTERARGTGEEYATPKEFRSEVKTEGRDGLQHIQIDWRAEPDDPSVSSSCLRLLYVLNEESIICSVKFNADGSMFAFANGRHVFVCVTATGALALKLEMAQMPVTDEKYTRAVRFSPDGRMLAATCGKSAICVFDLETGRRTATLDDKHSIVSALLFSNDSTKLYSGGFEGNLCIWDMVTMRHVRTISHGKANEPQDAKDPNDMIVALACPADESFLVVGFMGGNVGIYSFDFDQAMSKFGAHQEFLLNVSVSPYDSTIATASRDCTVKLWNLRGVANLRETLRGHENFVLTVCFAPNSSIVMTGSKDEKIIMWNYKTNSRLLTIHAHKNTMFDLCHHPTKNVFVSCSGDGLVCVWEYSLPV